MLRPLFLSLMLSALAVPAMAMDVKQEVEQISTAYTEAVAKHDAAAVASLYAKDAIWISPAGEAKTNVKAIYEENFKNGEDKIVVRIGNIWPQGNDAALAQGDVDVTFGKDPPVSGFWSGVYVREGGQMKIRMLTVGIKPPPPKEASADKK